jgi:hypothetical protein
MKIGFWSLLFLVPFVFSTAFGAEDDPRTRQEQWARQHTAEPRIIEVANPHTIPLEEFSKLRLNTLPHPEVYHLYLRDHEGSTCRLVKDARSQTMRLVRLYGTVGIEAPNYVTRGQPATMLPKETLVNPLPTSFKGSRSYPSVASTSYPTGVRTYYVTINGKRIELDRGHGVPHADTLQHAGKISTKDSENYVPQNVKYNSPIRRDLEADLSNKRLSYKEICIYHNNFMYDVTARVKKKDKNYNIPIPEGFLFLTFAEGGEIQDVYYFPNFIDYEELKAHQPDYKHFPALYRLPNLSQLFLVPEVTLGLVEEHQEKVDLAQRLANKILLFAPTFFDHLTEQQMPPKARVALLTTLLEWNIESAATLEFLTFAHQLQLAQFYLTSRRNYWELDDRYEAEKKLSMSQFLGDKEVSPTAQQLVKFLDSHLNFLGLQAHLQGLVNRFEEVYRNASFHWKTPEFYPEITTLTAKNDNTHQYNLAMIALTDISKIKRLIGGASNHSLPRAQYVLSMIDARARQTPSIVMEKLGMMRLYHDNEGLGVTERHIFWERAILEQVRSGVGITLLDRRRVADYYSYRKKANEKAFWLQQFVSYVQANPTLENFIQIADWCADRRAAFLQDLEEQVDPNAATRMLALQIYKALNYFSPSLYRERCAGPIHSLQESLGFYQSDPLGIVKTNILSPVCLDPLLDGGATGSMLKQLSYLLLKAVYPTNIEKLYAQIPQEEFEEALAKKSTDFKHEAALYHKLGLRNEAQKAAEDSFRLAKNSFEFKEAALIFLDMGMKDLALAAANQSLKSAQQYKDFIYAIEAFHKLRNEELKQKSKYLCFQSIGEKDYDFVCVAVEFYKLGLHDLANEAASLNYQRAKTSSDLNFAVHIFEQHGVRELAIEAANYCFKIAKDETDVLCAQKNFMYLKLPFPTK